MRAASTCARVASPANGVAASGVPLLSALAGRVGTANPWSLFTTCGRTWGVGCVVQRFAHFSPLPTNSPNNHSAFATVVYSLPPPHDAMYLVFYVVVRVCHGVEKLWPPRLSPFFDNSSLLYNFFIACASSECPAVTDFLFVRACLMRTRHCPWRTLSAATFRRCRWLLPTSLIRATTARPMHRRLKSSSASSINSALACTLSCFAEWRRVALLLLIAVRSLVVARARIQLAAVFFFSTSFLFLSIDCCWRRRHNAAARDAHRLWLRGGVVAPLGL